MLEEKEIQNVIGEEVCCRTETVSFVKWLPQSDAGTLYHSKVQTGEIMSTSLT